MKRILTLFLVALLLPIVGGAFCPCAEADSSGQQVLQNIPCRYCCPESNLSKSGCRVAVIGSQAVSNAQGRIQNLRSAPVEANPISLIGSSFRPPIRLTLHQPWGFESETYLILRVLRL